MKANRLNLLDESTRKHVRRVLGCHERNASVQDLIGALLTGPSNEMVKLGLRHELRRRYMQGIAGAGAHLVNQSAFTAVERLWHEPRRAVDGMALDRLRLQSQLDRCDVWVTLQPVAIHSADVDEQGLLALRTAWLALSLHYRLMEMEWPSVASIVGALPSFTGLMPVCVFAEALYGFGPYVWVGFKWSFAGPTATFGGDHEIYRRRWVWRIHPFTVGCSGCTLLAPGLLSGPNGLLKCAGTDRPRPAAEVAEIVESDSCPAFVSRTKPVLEK